MGATRWAGAACVMAAAATLLSAPGAEARRVTVNLKDNPATNSYFFDPAYLVVSRGDTIVWNNMGSMIHTTTSDEALWDSGLLNPGATFLTPMTVAGSHHFHCVPHADLGMRGVVTVITHSKIDVQMNDDPLTSSYFFDPADVTVSPDDTIRWVNSGHTLHTATSGIPGDPGAGVLFDSGSLSVGSTFRWVVKDTSGVLDYFCRFHNTFGMVGTITIQPTGIRPGEGTGITIGTSPLPASGDATIQFSLERAGNVRVEVLDVSGRVVARLADGRYSAGAHALLWAGRGTDGRRAANGVYYVRVATDDAVRHARLVLLRD